MLCWIKYTVARSEWQWTMYKIEIEKYLCLALWKETTQLENECLRIVDWKPFSATRPIFRPLWIYFISVLNALQQCDNVRGCYSSSYRLITTHTIQLEKKNKRTEDELQTAKPPIMVKAARSTNSPTDRLAWHVRYWPVLRRRHSDRRAVVRHH